MEKIPGEEINKYENDFHTSFNGFPKGQVFIQKHSIQIKYFA